MATINYSRSHFIVIYSLFVFTLYFHYSMLFVIFQTSVFQHSYHSELSFSFIILTVDRVGVAEVLDCLLDDWPCELFSSYVLVEQASLGEYLRTDIRLDSGSISPHYFVGVLSASAGLPLVQHQNVFAQLSADMQ